MLLLTTTAERSSDVELALEIEALDVGEPAGDRVRHLVSRAVDDLKLFDELRAEILEALFGAARLFFFDLSLIHI